MDALDRKIVGVLQSEGRISLSDLAEALPLSASATSDRLKRLLREGVISGFGARVDAKAIGRPIEALIDVRLRPGSTWSPSLGDEWLKSETAIVDAVHLTGRFDLQLTVATVDVGELDLLLTEIKERLNAEETNTKLVLRQLEGFPRSPAI